MNQNKIRSILLNLAEQKAPSAQINLWPAIHSRVQMSQSSQSRGTIMNPHSNSQRRQLKPAYILLAILLIGALFLVFPQGRALAQEILHFFKRGESNFMPGVTVTPIQWVEQTPGEAAATITPQPTESALPGLAFESECGSYNNPHCSIEAIHKLVGFPVYALSELPDGMNFSGATGSPEEVYLLYETANQTGALMISEVPFNGDENIHPWEVGADADIRSLQIGQLNLEYVKGSYNGNSNPPIWNPDADVQMIRWVNQGILFNLTMIGVEPLLDQNDLADLVATLTDKPLDKVGLSVPETPHSGSDAPTEEAFDFSSVYPLTLAQAEEKAGFTLLSPSRLPERLSFAGAKYDEETKVVDLFYRYTDPNFMGSTDGLLVSEQLAPEGVDCDLCGFVQGNGKQVEQYATGKLVSQEATIETVQIGDLEGKYLEGVGWVSKDDINGWQWDSTPYVKRLRFQINERAIAATYFGFDLAKADMIAIAESLK